MAFIISGQILNWTSHFWDLNLSYSINYDHDNNDLFFKGLVVLKKNRLERHIACDGLSETEAKFQVKQDKFLRSQLTNQWKTNTTIDKFWNFQEIFQFLKLLQFYMLQKLEFFWFLLGIGILIMEIFFVDRFWFGILTKFLLWNEKPALKNSLQGKKGYCFFSLMIIYQFIIIIN